MPIPNLDVNNLDIGTVMKIIGQYPSPEAAGSDMFMNAPRAMEAMKNVYQTATGDQTGDPFLGLADRNMSRVYNQVAADQWSTAARAPIPADPMAVANEAAYNLRHPEELRLREIQESPVAQEITKSLLGRGASSIPVAPAALPGTAPQYRSTVDSNPHSISYGIDEQLLNDPKFATLQKQNPELAAKTYKTLTGQDYKTALGVITALRKDRESVEDQIVKGLAGTIDFDPATGKLAKRMIRMGSENPAMGSLSPSVPTTHFVPLNPVEQQLIDNGTFTRKTGIDLRQKVAQQPATIPTDLPQNKHRQFKEIYERTLKETGDPKRASLHAERTVLGYSPAVEKAKSAISNKTIQNFGRKFAQGAMQLPSEVGNVATGVADVAYDELRRILNSANIGINLPRWSAPPYVDRKTESQMLQQMYPGLIPR